MVNNCLICRNVRDVSVNRALHQFPSNPQLRYNWMERLCLDPELCTSKYLYICSDHFAENDFNIFPSGTKSLKQSALPSIVNIASVMQKSVPRAVSIPTYTVRSSTTGVLHGKQIAPIIQGQEPHKLNRDYNKELRSSFQKHKELFLQKRQYTTFKKPRYIGDIKSETKTWAILRKTTGQRRKIISSLRKSEGSLRNRVNNLKSLLAHIDSKFDISADNITKVLDPERPLFKRMLKGQSAGQCFPEFRTFALTLSFYSSKAYEYIKETFSKNRPS